MKEEVFPRVFPIVVHYGDPAITSKLVAQLRTENTVVIDNTKENTGYGGGVNRGLGMLMHKAAPDDIVIVINNDVVVAPRSLEVVQKWWRDHPGPALAGVKMGYVNVITGRAKISASTALASPDESVRIGGDPLTWRAKFVFPYLHGSCLIAPLKVFLALQGVPNQYFMYWEDVDFSRRARQAGLPLHVIPGTGIEHDDSRHALTDDQLYYLVRNGAFFLAHYSPRPWQYYWRIWNPLRLVYHWLLSHRTIARALYDALRGELGKRI